MEFPERKSYPDGIFRYRLRPVSYTHLDVYKRQRMGRCSIKESFVTISNKGEILFTHLHISPYEKGNIFNKDPLRVRKLLLHKSEINKLAGQIKMKGYTLMPLKVYFKGSLVKVEIGLARGKKLYDKRQDLAKMCIRARY